MLKADTSAWNIAKGFPRRHAPAVVADLTVNEVEKLREALRNARNAETLALPSNVLRDSNGEPVRNPFDGSYLTEEDLKPNAVVKWLEDKLA